MSDKQSAENQEETLPGGDHQYRRLIEQMLNAYSLQEIICDDQGQPIDYRFLDVNPAFEQMTGLRADSLVGHTVLEVLPLAEPSWIEKFGRVALTGEPSHFEDFSRQLNRHFEVMAFCPGPKRFVCIIADMTERKQAEQALIAAKEQVEKSVEFLENIINNIGDPVFVKDNQSRLILVNDAFCTILDLERDQIIGKTLAEDISPDEMEEFLRADRQVLDNGIEDIREERLTVRGGETRTIHTRKSRFIDNSGNRFLIGIIRDISERKHAEDALRQRTQLLEASQSIARVGGWELDLATHELYWTAETYRIHDTSPAEFTPTVDAGVDYYLPESRRIISDALQVAMERGEGYDLVLETLTTKGRRIDVRTTCEVTMVEGRPAKLTGIFQDITEQKKAESALAAEKERLAVTLRSIGDGVITTDTTGAIVMLNKMAETLTGWTTAEAVGRPLPEVFNIINELTRQPSANPVERVLSTGGIVELANHTCLITKNGREIVIADSGAPIHDNESRVIGVVLVFRDMTEKQKLEDFMQKSQKLESLGVLAGGIAHDFNNLLGAIFGYTELAISKTTDDKVLAYLAKSVNSIDRARSLTQQLLTFAKGGAPIRKVENLFPFIQETAQFALSGSSVSSRVQVQENLWPCDLDKNQIGQVIDNLIINAQQAMPTGGIIAISAQNITLAAGEHVSLVAGNYVKLSIKDQGIGIPKEFLPRIFDPYYTTKTKGHGLGLATCYSIISQHDGWIDVESEPGRGTTFHLYLPASLESHLITEGESAVDHIGSGTFLIMDDEEVIGEVMKEVIESFGYTVMLTSRGEDAIDFCVAEAKANRTIAGMIFDLTIPGGMGGKEAIVEIRRTYPDTPAFVSSGYSVDPIMANPQDYGFNASLPKPFTIEELSDMLEKHLETSG